MATRKKTTTRRPRATSAQSAVEVESTREGLDRSSGLPPSELMSSEEEGGVRLNDGRFLDRVRQVITDHPLLAVVGVAGLAVTIAVAARD